jgi:hypothetical protein
MEYFVLVGAETRGPFSREQLHGQRLPPETLVWRRGLAGWTRADAVEDLRAGWTAPPPPLPRPDDPYASPQRWDDPPGYPPRPTGPHSGLGIASVAFGVLGALAMGGALGIAMYAAVANKGEVDEQSPLIMTVGFLFCAGVPLNILGIGLGIAGLVQKDRRKLFAIIGLSVNAGMLLVMGGILVLGLVAG